MRSRPYLACVCGLSLFLLGVSVLLGAQATPQESLLVLSKGNLHLAVIDPTTLRVVARIPSGPDPHEVAASADGRTAFITNYGTGRGGFNTLTVADLVGQKALPAVDLGALRGPHGITLGGDKIYFTAEVNKAIGRYDPAAKQVDWIMGTGQDITHMLVVSNDQKRIVTVNILSATASILDAVSAQPAAGGRGRGTRFAPGGNDWSVTTVKVGEPSEEYEGFDVSPDGKMLWTASPRSGKVAIVDVVEKKLVESLDAKVSGANRVKFTPDGKLVFVSSLSGGGANSGGSVTVFDAATRKELKRVPACQASGGILLRPDGSTAYVSCSRENIVAVIDVKTLVVTGRIDAGTQPDGLAWAIRR